MVRSKVSNDSPKTRCPICSRVQTGLFGEGREDVEFGSGEGKTRPAASHVARVQIDGQIEQQRTGPDRDAVDRGGDRRPARKTAETPQDRTDPGHDFARLERLRNVVVGAELESGDAVDDIVAGGQHQDADVRPFGSKRPQYIEAGPAGQHHVENQQVQPVVAAVVERGFAVGRLDDLVALPFEVGADHGPDMRFVVGDENFGSHGGNDSGVGPGAKPRRVAHRDGRALCEAHSGIGRHAHGHAGPGFVSPKRASHDGHGKPWPPEPGRSRGPGAAGRVP